MSYLIPNRLSLLLPGDFVMKLKLRFVNYAILLTLGLISFVVVLTFPAQKAIVKRLETADVCESQLHAKSFARTELLFGLSKPNRAVITEGEFQHFIDQKVTPLFPEGLTLLSATGQFKNDHDVVIKEDAKLLLLLYPVNPKSHRNVEQIRQAYKTMFQQESVLRVDDRSCVSFSSTQDGK
jgi:hypothetical protein